MIRKSLDTVLLMFWLLTLYGTRVAGFPMADLGSQGGITPAPSPAPPYRDRITRKSTGNSSYVKEHNETWFEFAPQHYK